MRQMRRLKTQNILRNLRASVGFLEGDEEGSSVGLKEGVNVTGLWVGCILGPGVVLVTVEVLVAIDVEVVVAVASLLLVDDVDVMIPPWLLALVQSSMTKHSSPATPNKLFSQHSSALSKK